MRVVITGASGLLGKTLASLHVTRGDTVRGLVRDAARAANGLPGVELVEGDLVDDGARLVALIDGADIVYHCAAELYDPARMFATNVEGTRRLLDAAAGRIGRWVQVSTVAVYGRIRTGTITEESPLAPAEDYSRTKAMADELVTDLAMRGGFDHVILRTCAMIGPGMKGRFLHRLCGLLDRRLFALIDSPGALVSLIPVANVTHALYDCARLPQAAGRIYNLAEQCTVEHLVELCCEALGRKPPRWRLPESLMRAAASLAERLAPGSLTREHVDILTSQTRYDIGRIVRELEYKVVMSCDDAIKELVLEWRNIRN